MLTAFATQRIGVAELVAAIPTLVGYLAHADEELIAAAAGMLLLFHQQGLWSQALFTYLAQQPPPVPAHVLAALKAECVDYLNIGGSSRSLPKAAALAEAADVPIWVQMGGLCTGVLATWSVHLQCTIPNATLPCDELPFTREADVLGGSLELKEGHFTVPAGPGLGVQVDLKVVEKYRVG